MKLNVTIEIDIDEADYATAYGLAPAEVVADATTHLTSVVAHATGNALDRLGAGASLIGDLADID